MNDADYMRRAIELARKARGFTNPNPMVGAVIVKDGRIIAEGYHHKCGDLHAERNAFTKLTESAEGATIYVTLEPCCHYGKQPPCTEAIVENKIAKVVIGSRDPNPLVSGKGTKFLREHGIEVVEDFLRDQCDQINPVFFHYITKKKPYVVMKYAMTADGKIATKTGDSKWITGDSARAEVQQMRHNYMGIMAGIGTVLADDPMLNVRVEGLKSPVRIIVDSKLRIPVDCQIVNSSNQYRTIVACVDFSEFDESFSSELEEKKARLEGFGIEVMQLPSRDGHVDVEKLMDRLGQDGIDSVFIEGGGILNDSIRAAGLVDRLEVFVGPKIFGGANAKSPIEGIGVSKVNEAIEFDLVEVKQIGQDVLLSYERR